MHERYSFGAFLLAFPMLAFGRRRYGRSRFSRSPRCSTSCIRSRIKRDGNASSGVDATNLWAPVRTSFRPSTWRCFLRSATCISAGRSCDGYRGGRRCAPRCKGARVVRSREGIVAMRALDWVWAASVHIASFILCRLWLQYPTRRSSMRLLRPRGEEYLKHMEIFELPIRR